MSFSTAFVSINEIHVFQSTMIFRMNFVLNMISQREKKSESGGKKIRS